MKSRWLFRLSGSASSLPRLMPRVEEIFACGDRVGVRWLYRWIEPDGPPGHVCGVDIFCIWDGKIAEKLSYVKG
jgi:hypothetical protein